MYLLGQLMGFSMLVADTSDLAAVPLNFPACLSEMSYRFSTHDGKGAVLFPDKPKESKRTLRIGGSSVTLRLATYATVNGDIFLFGYVDLPASSPDANAILQGVHEGLIRDNPMIQQSKLAFGEEKLPGLEVTWSKDDKHMVCRYILQKKRLYQIMVFGSRQFITSDTARAFLDSLIIE